MFRAFFHVVSLSVRKYFTFPFKFVLLSYFATYCIAFSANGAENRVVKPGGPFFLAWNKFYIYVQIGKFACAFLEVVFLGDYLLN